MLQQHVAPAAHNVNMKCSKMQLKKCYKKCSNTQIRRRMPKITLIILSMLIAVGGAVKVYYCATFALCFLFCLFFVFVPYIIFYSFHCK